MLKKFTVTNFKNFKTTTSFDLGNPSNYEFNSCAINNGIVSKCLVYGKNGSGKSNLALAIFDIVIHLTDKERVLDKYFPYLNLDSPKQTADFEYVFVFDGMEIIYRYAKKDPLTLTHETLLINNIEVLDYDHSERKGYTSLAGAETLQLSSSLITETDRLSRVKYIRSNAILADNAVNRAFVAFMAFVDNMLMFYSLDEKRYQGFCVGVDSYTQGIIRENKVQEFENFLRDQGIDYKLVVGNTNGQPDLYCKMGNNIVQFVLLASTGTKSLALFYYWYLRMGKSSLVFIDEYDAFYHFELSQSIVELLKELSGTQVILSTHNTDLMSNDLLRPDAYFLIQENNIKSIEKCTEKELRKAHNIQKMYKAGSFNE